MTDAIPAKWQLAHMTWFFETFVLEKWGEFKPFDPGFRFLFNSHHNSTGDKFPRAQGA